MNQVVKLANYAQRRVENMFGGFFRTNSKHDHYRDFGYPERLTFDQLYRMYSRNGIAAAGIDKTIRKTWQDNPFLLEQERDGSQQGTAKETPIEKEIRQRFEDLRVWARLAEADRMSMVGAYSGVILRFADGKAFNQPLGKVTGGLKALVEIIPVWEGQLRVSEWDTVETSETYGQPKMFQFSESAVDTNKQQPRNIMIHPDRIIIWSKDGSVNGSSALEAGYNSLVDMEKVRGAGGEGFWKNAKSAPVFEVDKEAKIAEMAKAMGVTVEDLADKMNEQVADYNAGFDQMLMIMGMQAKQISVNLPSPEHFYAVALQDFAASMNIPVKILVGMQTGERASQEDADEWAQTNMSRRANQTIPNIKLLIDRLERVGILDEKDWFIDWADLTEASMSEKVDRADKMADVNQKTGQNEWVFTPEEIRAAVGYEPLSDAVKARDDVSEDELDAAVTPPARDPEGLNIGYIGAWNENVRQDGGRVLLDKVIDVEVANRSEGGKAVLAAIEAGGPIHTSTGLLAVMEAVNAEDHKRVARAMVFDHDAILLNEDGAATPDQGVGMLVNAKGEFEEIEVVNSAMTDAADQEIDWAGTRLVEALMRRQNISVWEKVKSAIMDAIGSGREPSTNTKELDMTVEEQLKALSAKVDALSEGKPNEAMNKTIADAVTAAVNAAVKPLTDAHATMVANQKAKDDAEQAELVTKIVNAKILDEATAKATPLATLRALAPQADPKKATALNSAFGGGQQESGFKLPKGDK